MTRRVAWWAVVAALTVATLAAGALGGGLMLVKNRQLPANRAANRHAVLEVAKADVAKVLTYTADTVEQDTRAAEEVLTGAFLDYYRQFARQQVIPAARSNGITATATVTHAGVESLTTGKASVLLFVDQSTTSRDKPAPVVTASSVRAGLTKVSGEWLIDSMNPV
ncbi:hypothetical protein A4G26_21335 [Mycobacterium kansasii]|uniref:Twin-arginine translocation pathway signal n=1 Tax=Mycobacterium innocens TaxID=2341083 RepID=A0A498QC21_9MYCO|nr:MULTISPECIES: hypothetical protein [Mycobacterium]KZS77124.1 hypothetical protein A4G26_21335 [Mycobacterium kansasii]VBA42152.1 hypothetical protein LAUMK13_03888 [Mycobacterium innocens]